MGRKEDDRNTLSADDLGSLDAGHITLERDIHEGKVGPEPGCRIDSFLARIHDHRDMKSHLF